MCADVFNTLRKCWYPSCVGQAAAAWVLSPLGSNILLSLVKGTDQLDKYVQIHNTLKTKQSNQIDTGLFISPNCKQADRFKTLPFSGVSRHEVDFTNSERASKINQWITNRHMIYSSFNIMDNNPPPVDTNIALINVCNFECPWKTTSTNGRFMKVHNSFNYTQDVNYDARMVELPIGDEDFRVIVLMPHQDDLLNTLFRRLTNEGLAATFASVHPLFSVKSVFTAPDISVKSQIDVDLDEDNKSKFPNESLIQCGAISIDSHGVRAYVISCLYSTESKSSRSASPVKKKEAKPFFFAITFKDTPIFTGQYISPT